MGLESGSLGHVQFLLGDHSGVWAELGALIPGIHSLALISGQVSEANTTEDAGTEEPPSEGLACLVSGVNVGEIVHPSLLGYNRNTTLVSLCAATDPNSEGSSQETTNNGVGKESELKLALSVALVLPCPSLGAGHVFTEARGDPWVREELVVKPIS